MRIQSLRKNSATLATLLVLSFITKGAVAAENVAPVPSVPAETTQQAPESPTPSVVPELDTIPTPKTADQRKGEDPVVKKDPLAPEQTALPVSESALVATKTEGTRPVKNTLPNLPNRMV